MEATASAGMPAPVETTAAKDLWDDYGSGAYALAAALLGSSAAAEAVGLAIGDLAGSVRGRTTEQVRHDLVSQVYRRAQGLAGRNGDAVVLPPIITWVSGLARLQRESLALCAYGGLTHREAAALLEVSPRTVADLLRFSLRELGASLRHRT